jgi:cell division protein FtsI/penicillin-binding protein 2
MTFFSIKLRNGLDRLVSRIRSFVGFGSKLVYTSNQEVLGLVPDPQWKESQKGENWYLGNTYHFGIGQGDLLVTPIQVAIMTQAIANHGVLCQSSLLPITQQNCRDLGIKEEHLNLVLSGMLGACSQGGTAYPLFPHNSRLMLSLDASLPDTEKIDQGMIACKTGTAEFGAADERGYRQTHAWTTAIIGIDQEQLQEQVVDPVVTLTAEQIDQRKRWLELVKTHGFPDKLVMTVLVESSSDKIYSEGSTRCCSNYCSDFKMDVWSLVSITLFVTY